MSKTQAPSNNTPKPVVNSSIDRLRQSPMREFVCGWGAGCAETCILYPLVKLTFRQQLYGIRLRVAFSQVLYFITMYVYN